MYGILVFVFPFFIVFFFSYIMLSKLTSKNQLTLPKSVVSEFPDIEYFEVTKEMGRIVLTPVTIVHADTIRTKLAELGVSEEDVAAAIAWARQSK